MQSSMQFYPVVIGGHFKLNLKTPANKSAIPMSITTLELWSCNISEYCYFFRRAFSGHSFEMTHMQAKSATEAVSPARAACEAPDCAECLFGNKGSASYYLK